MDVENNLHIQHKVTFNYCKSTKLNLQEAFKHCYIRKPPYHYQKMAKMQNFIAVK